jgi:MFS transporter, DHA1 family, tetracycline resistance protein
MAAQTVTPRPAALIFIFITVLLDMMGIGIIIPVLPKLIEHFLDGNTTRAAEMVGIFGSAWAIMQFIFSPLLGSLSDRFGRRPVVLLSNLGMGLDYILMALAPALSWLFVGRLISGITAASVATAGAYVADISAPENRAKNFGMLGTAFGVGFILGPALGGVLGSLNVHYPFWAAAGLSLANFAYGYFILPESFTPENRSAFSWAKANPFGSIELLARQRELWGLGLVTFLSQLAHTSLPSIYVLYAGYRYGWGPGQVGILLAGVGLASMIVQGGLVQPIIKRVGERPALLTGLICASIGMTWYGTAWEGSLVWLGIPFAAFWGLFNATSQSMMSQRVSASEQGQLQGANSSIMAFAGIVGPALFANVFARSIDPAHGINLPGMGFWLAGFCLLLAFIVATVLTRRSVAQRSPAADEA